MTLPSGGNTPPISLSDINAEFGLGTNLGAYRGGIWGKADDTSGVFAATNLKVSDFYSKAKVVAGSASNTTAGSGSFTVKPYKTITIVLRGGGGQGGGGGGTTNNTNTCNTPVAGSGANGVGSSFGSSGNAWNLNAAAGGGGAGGSGQSPGTNGTQGTDGAGYDGAVARASGGGGSTTGGNGGGGGMQTITLTNPALGGTGPVSGSSIAYSLGAGGYQTNYGEGRSYVVNIYGFGSCNYDGNNNGGNGAKGADGSVTITWTGQ